MANCPPYPHVTAFHVSPLKGVSETQRTFQWPRFMKRSLKRK
jgi:hypothetical protein